MQTIRRIVAVLLVVAFMVTVFPMNSTELFAAVSEQNDTQTEDNSHITRAEWLHELVMVFDMTVESGAEPDNYFNDLPESHKYYNDVILAVEFGVVDIKEGESIYPDDFVTRDFAATTLNFCLGYQQTENDEYIFSDYEDCSSPFDALVAVEKGWLSLVDGKFMPQRTITETEAKGMIEYAASVLNMTDIDAEYDSSYTFEEGIIVISPEISVSENGDYITVEDCSEKIQPGDKFVVYINGIPNMYEAVTVEENGNVLTIQKTDVEYNDSVKDADAQGQVSSENMDFIAADGVEIEVEDEISVTPQKKITGLKSVRSSKRIKKNIKAKSTVTLAPGITASINVKINNPVVNYQILGNYSYVTLEGETEISYSVKGDLAEALGRKSITLFTCSVGGIGNFDVTAELSFSGSASGTVTGYLVAGIECRRGDRIRMVRSFQQKEYYCTVEAEASAGIKVALGATKLPVVNAYIYAEIGAKANLKSSYYTTEPKKCTHFAAYMYLKYGAYASVKFGGWKTSVEYNVDVFHDKNSPIRIVHHYENGIEVPSCTRGTVYSDFFTRWNSRYGGSGWSGYNGIYGLSSQGTQIPLYEYKKINDGTGIEITKYNGNSYYVSIPSTIDGLPVTSIGSESFEGKSVVIVSIPDTVTNIGSSAFSGCTNLKTVNLPKSLTYLDAYAFENTAIESIEIPKSLSGCGHSFLYDYPGCFKNAPL